jgi:hypothetical protein
MKLNRIKRGIKMKKSLLIKIFCFVVVFSFLASTGSASAVSSNYKSTNKNDPMEYLIGMVWPDESVIKQLIPVEKLTLVNDMVEQGVINSLANYQASLIIDKLLVKQENNEIRNFSIDYANFAIQVETDDPSSLEDLKLLPTVLYIAPTGKAQIDSCSINSAENISDYFRFALQALRAQSQLTSQLIMDSGEPSIHVYYNQYTPYRFVYGFATPKSLIQMTILRGGQSIAVFKGYSDEVGYYYFGNSYDSCTSNYNWTIEYGDVIEIRDGDHISQFTFVTVSAWGDPTTNLVYGYTEPNRTVQVDLGGNVNSQPCSTSSTQKTGSSDNDGYYHIDFSADYAINNLSYLTVEVLDANNNGAYTYGNIYFLEGASNSNILWGSIFPNDSYTVTIKRSNENVATFNGVADNRGYIPDVMIMDGFIFQSGDIVTLVSDHTTLSTEVISIDNFTVDTNTKVVSGITTEPNTNIYVYLYQYNLLYNDLGNGCTNNTCQVFSTASDGSFSITVPELQKGDQVQVYFLDSFGNYHSAFQNTRALYAVSSRYEHDRYSIEGYWSSYNSALTASVFDASNNLIETRTQTVNSNEFNFYISTSLHAGYRIQVSDGENQEELILQNTTKPRLSMNEDAISGSLDAGGHITAVSGNTCIENDLGTGAFEIPFGVDIPSNANGKLVYESSTGNYQLWNTISFSMTVNPNESYYVYTETESPMVNMSIYRNGVEIDSFSSRGMSPYFLMGGFEFQPGDIIDITTEDGISQTYTIQDFDLSYNAAENAVTGSAPAGSQVSASVYQSTFAFSSPDLSTIGWANAMGTVNLPLNGTVLWDCSLLPDNCNTVHGTMTAADGLNYNIYSRPQPAQADVFENDNAQADATILIPLEEQSHTMHSADDVDWFKFYVAPADIALGQEFIITTYDLGYGFGFTMYLVDEIDSDSSTLVYPSTNGQGPVLSFTPSHSGWYSIKIEPHMPMYPYLGGYCASYYSIRLSTAYAFPKIFLPFVKG